MRLLNREISFGLAGTTRYWKLNPALWSLYTELSTNIPRLIPSNAKLADIGAGQLAYKLLLQKHVSSYLAIDLNQRKPGLDCVGDANSLPILTNCFDVVFCSQVLEHVPDPFSVFAELVRITKPGGHIIVSVPMLGYIHNAPHDYYRFTSFGLEAIAHKYHLQVMRLQNLGGWFSFLGYIFCNLTIPLIKLPLIGIFIIELNHLGNQLCLNLDKITNSQKLFPLNCILYAKKTN